MFLNSRVKNIMYLGYLVVRGTFVTVVSATCRHGELISCDKEDTVIARHVSDGLSYSWENASCSHEG